MFLRIIIRVFRFKCFGPIVYTVSIMSIRTSCNIITMSPSCYNSIYNGIKKNNNNKRLCHFRMSLFTSNTLWYQYKEETLFPPELGQIIVSKKYTDMIFREEGEFIRQYFDHYLSTFSFSSYSG